MTPPRPSENQGFAEVQKELEQLLVGLVEVGLSAERKARLGELLKAHAEARVFYKRYLEIHAMLQWESGAVDAEQSEPDLLQDLLRMEQAAEAELVHDIGLLSGHHQAPAQTRDAVRWLINNPAVLGGVAALLAIALILTVIFASGNATPPLANTPQTPRTDQPDKTTQPDTTTPITTPAAVATLTNTHNAAWTLTSADQPAERASARGSDLHPGTRLNLTAGFVEITTHRGAIAILEAPATIELLDDNALQLHAGKLVGICKTPSSKGFLVRTDHGDIIDVGTEFGVEVMQDGTANAVVFVGEIEVSEADNTLGQPDRSIRLTAGWSSSVDFSRQQLPNPVPLTEMHKARFVKSMDEASDPATAYRRTVLASRPLVYWGFDEQQRKTQNLAGLSKWNGSAIGQTDYAQGLFGSALKLSGQIQTMGGVISDAPLPLDDLNRFTLEAWCWVEQPHHGRVISLTNLFRGQDRKATHASMLEVVGGDQLTALMRQYSPSIRFLHRNAVTPDAVMGQNVFTDTGSPTGQWVHLVAVRDGSQAKVYINGEMVSAENDERNTDEDGPLDLIVGVSPHIRAPQFANSDSEFRCFNGLIDEVAVYDTALQLETIQTHYRLGLPDDAGQLLP